MVHHAGLEHLAAGFSLLLCTFARYMYIVHVCMVIQYTLWYDKLRKVILYLYTLCAPGISFRGSSLRSTNRCPPSVSERKVGLDSPCLQRHELTLLRQWEKLSYMTYLEPITCTHANATTQVCIHTSHTSTVHMHVTVYIYIRIQFIVKITMAYQ